MSDDQRLDDLPDPHPDAFKVLYDAYRTLGCVAAVDPVDPDDCASVAAESVRVLLAANLLVPPGVEITEEWAVRLTWTENFGGGFEIEKRLSEAGARRSFEYARRSVSYGLRVERLELIRRPAWTGAWEVVSDG
jgi:hypothetical protein